ncbi:MAG TPA: hypothetical protein VF251_12905 [Pyrinomonadaceae bacterium]
MPHGVRWFIWATPQPWQSLEQLVTDVLERIDSSRRHARAPTKLLAPMMAIPVKIICQSNIS